MNKYNLSIVYLIIFTCIAGQNLIAGPKKVIGVRKAGLFSNFFGVLNMLAWCERNASTPVIYWGADCLYWQKDGYNGSATNAWEYYFEPVSTLSYKAGDTLYKKYFAPDGTGIKFMSRQCYDILSYKRWGHSLISKYIRIKKQVRDKIDRFIKQHFIGKKVIGIHLRGTDKNKEVKVVSPMEILQEANKYVGYTYFVATDEQRLLDLAKQHLRGQVIYYNADRSTTGEALHIKNSSAKRGEDVLIEVMLFSKCDLFIHTCSNVSCAALFFNPDLNHKMLLPKRFFADDFDSELPYDRIYYEDN